MKTSLYIELVEKWFSTIKGKIDLKINGKKEAGEYLHEHVLTTEYTHDLKWDSASVSDVVVAADVVALDSPLPLKKRGSLARASGSIVKTGMKKSLNESEITNLNILGRLGKWVQMIAKLFEDTPKCALGIKERVEMMFLEAISTGFTIVGGIIGDTETEDNTGTAVRVNFGFLDKNKYKATIKWGELGYTPISDIERAVAGAESTIAVIWLSKIAYSLLRNSDESKRLYANFKSIPIQTNSILPTPNKSQFNEAFEEEYGITFKVIDREIITEKNGKRTKIKPFSVDTLVLLTQDTDLGRVVYGELAEETNPVAGVVYEKIGDYILISKYAKNDPLREFTSSQALVLPVIDGVSEIYLLQTQEAAAPSSQKAAAPTPNSDEVTVGESNFPKADVIAALNAIGVPTTGNTGVPKVTEKVVALTEEQLAELLEILNS